MGTTQKSIQARSRNGKINLVIPFLFALVIFCILFYVLTRQENDNNNQSDKNQQAQNTESDATGKGVTPLEGKADSPAGDEKETGTATADPSVSPDEKSKLIRIFGKVTDMKKEPLEKIALRWIPVPVDRRQAQLWSNDARILQEAPDPDIFPEGKLRDAFAKSILTLSAKDGSYEILAPKGDTPSVVIAGADGFERQIKGVEEAAPVEKEETEDDDKDEDGAEEAKPSATSPPSFAREIELNFELETGYFISGKVTDKQSKQPVEGMAVLAGIINPSEPDMRSFVKPDAPSAMTKADGTYMLQGLAPGEYRIVARTGKSIYISVPSKEGIRLSLDRNYLDVDFEVLPGGCIFGIITDPDNQPVADVRCIAMPSDFMSMAMQGQAEQLTLMDHQGVTTNKEGFYEIVGLVLGKEYSLNAEGKGLALTRSKAVKLTKEKPEAEMNLVLKYGVSVSGVVVFEDSTPAADVRVMLRTELQDMLKGEVLNKQTTSDETGVFFFENIPPGSYTLSTEKTSSANLLADSKTSVRITVKEDEDVADIDLLARRQHENSISGIVLDNDGLPVAEANINVFSAQNYMGVPPSRTRTQDDGTFIVKNLDDSVFRVKAIKAGYTTTTVKDVKADTRGLTITINRYGTISGKVVMFDGGPVPAGGNVRPIAIKKESMKDTIEKLTEFRMLEQVSAPINEDGTFTVQAPVGEIVVRAMVSGFAPGESRVFNVKPAREYTGAEIHLTVGAVIHGRIVLADNTPVEGAAVTVELTAELEEKNMLKKFLPHMFGKGSDATSGADGYYEVPHLMEGDYTVTASHTNYSPSDPITVTVKTNEVVEAEPIVLHSGARITGTVRDEKGPKAGLLVQVVGVGAMKQATTGKNGEFSFKGVKKGAYMVQVIDLAAMQQGKMTMKTESIAVEDSQLVELEFVFGVGRKISGTVEGLPPAPFRVIQLRKPGGPLPEELDPLDMESQMKAANYHAGMGMVGSDGTYEIIDVEPGTYILEIPKMPEDPTDMEAYAKMEDRSPYYRKEITIKDSDLKHDIKAK